MSTSETMTAFADERNEYQRDRSEDESATPPPYEEYDTISTRSLPENIFAFPHLLYSSDLSSSSQRSNDERDTASVSRLEIYGPEPIYLDDVSTHGSMCTDLVSASYAMSSQSSSSGGLVRGLKIPVNITLGIAKGLHDAPRFYGDQTVRANKNVTGIVSGLKEAGKELSLGFYDGFTGLITRPIRGAAEGGAVGMAKGLVSGSMGVLVKPAAAATGMIAYSIKGMHKELEKRSIKQEAERACSGPPSWTVTSPDHEGRISDIDSASRASRAARSSSRSSEKTIRSKDEGNPQLSRPLLQHRTSSRSLISNEHSLQEEKRNGSRTLLQFTSSHDTHPRLSTTETIHMKLDVQSDDISRRTITQHPSFSNDNHPIHRQDPFSPKRESFNKKREHRNTQIYNKSDTDLDSIVDTKADAESPPETEAQEENTIRDSVAAVTDLRYSGVVNQASAMSFANESRANLC